MLEKLNLFNPSYNIGVIDVEVDGSVLEEKSFKMLELLLNYLNH